MGDKKVEMNELKLCKKIVLKSPHNFVTLIKLYFEYRMPKRSKRFIELC